MNMSQLYQRGLGILAGGVAAAGLATLLSGDTISANTKSLDGQVNKTPAVAQVQTPLDEYLTWFRDFTKGKKETGIRQYRESRNGGELSTFENDELGSDALGRDNRAELTLENNRYYIARFKRSDYIFEFTDLSTSDQMPFDTIGWNLSPKYEVRGFYRRRFNVANDVVIIGGSRKQIPLTNMTEADKRDFGQLDSRFREFLTGIGKSK